MIKSNSDKEDNLCPLENNYLLISEHFMNYRFNREDQVPPDFWHHLGTCGACQLKWEALQRQSENMIPQIKDYIDIKEAVAWAADESSRRAFAESLVGISGRPNRTVHLPDADLNIVQMAQSNAGRGPLWDRKMEDVADLIKWTLSGSGLLEKHIVEKLTVLHPSLGHPGGPLDLKAAEDAIASLRRDKELLGLGAELKPEQRDALLWFAVLHYAQEHNIHGCFEIETNGKDVLLNFCTGRLEHDMPTPKPSHVNQSPFLN